MVRSSTGPIAALTSHELKLPWVGDADAATRHDRAIRNEITEADGCTFAPSGYDDSRCWQQLILVRRLALIQGCNTDFGCFPPTGEPEW